MTLKEQLAALTAEARAIKARTVNGEISDDDAARVLEITKERESLEARLETMRKATEDLAALDTEEPEVSSTPDRKSSVKAKTLGDQFVQSDSFKAFKDRYPDGQVPKNVPIEVRAKDARKHRFARKDLLTSETGNPAPVRTGEVDDLVYRPERRLLEVITRGTTDLSWFEYRQIIAKTNNAAIVPEAVTSAPIGSGEVGSEVTEAQAGLKPLSGLTTTTAQAKAYTYADGMEVTNQELADDGVIATLINSTLMENVEIELENILLNGAGGSSGEPAGILNTTGVLQQAFATDMPTSIRKAITKLRVTSAANIQGVLLNPEDDEAWDLLKDSHGDFLGNGPYGMGPAMAWGYERIVSQAIPVGQALIGDFKTIHLLQKDPLEILAFNQHKDYAQRNLTYIRAEMRALQLIRNAARLCVVDLTA